MLVEKSIVMTECRDAIKKYNLVTLLKEDEPKQSLSKLDNFLETNKSSKYEKFTKLPSKEKEMAIAGLIQLGEALTFCRGYRDDKSKYDLLKQTGIIELAKNHANIRNILVHHFMYGNKLDELSKAIDTIDFDLLNQSLKKLENNDLQQLSRPEGKPSNDFPFEFSKYIDFLFQELEAVEHYLNEDSQKSDIGSQSGLKNHIRSAFSILLDLQDQLKDSSMANMNLGKNCKFEKETVREFNNQFVEYNQEFAVLFSQLRDFRNNLSHLDPANYQPFTLDQLREFASDLIKLKQDYTKQLKLYMAEKKNPTVLTNEIASDLFGLRNISKNEEPVESLYKKLFINTSNDEKEAKEEIKTKFDSQEKPFKRLKAEEKEFSLEKPLEKTPDSPKLTPTYSVTFFNPKKKEKKQDTTPRTNILGLDYSDSEEENNEVKTQVSPTHTP